MSFPKMHKSREGGINVRMQAHQSKEPPETKERYLLTWKREKQHVYSFLGSLKKKRNKRATAKGKMCLTTAHAESEGNVGSERRRGY